MNLEDLKSISDALIDNVREQNEKKTAKAKVEREKDARFWTPTIDENVEGSATIRFLPPQKGEKNPKIEYWEYNIQGPNGWYIEKSLNSLHQYHPELKAKGIWDPMGEWNSKLYKSGPEGQEQAKKQKRVHRMIANILVVDDPANPENNGKVFLFRFGPQVWNKVEALMFPPKGSREAPANPFDFWKGFDFNIIIKPNGAIVKGKKKPFPTYINSYFARSSTPVAGTDEEIVEIWNKTYSLKEFVDPDKYKSREELQKRINKVWGLGEAGTNATKPTESTKQQLELEEAMSNQSVSEPDSGSDLDDDIDINSILESIKSD